MDITWTENSDRYHDLIELNRLMNSPEESKATRVKAASVHAKIISQLKDKKLQSLRTRLVRASNAFDHREQEKITALIKNHTGEENV
jgi:hypothetical protein